MPSNILLTVLSLFLHTTWVTINRPDDTIKLAGCEIGTSSQVTFDLYAQVKINLSF